MIHIISYNHRIGSKNTTYIPLMVLAYWVIIYHRSHLSREPFETAIEPWRITKVSRRPLVPGDEVLMAYAAWHALTPPFNGVRSKVLP